MCDRDHWPLPVERASVVMSLEHRSARLHVLDLLDRALHRGRQVGERGADIGDRLRRGTPLLRAASVWRPRRPQRPGQREMRLASTSIIRWLAYKKVSSDSQFVDMGHHWVRHDGGYGF
jgi:hypothetical protein